MKILDIKANPNNPRLIKDEKFKKLVQSIKEFPKMMALRPMIINADNIVLGGNMRLKALKELGYKEVPDEWIKRAEDLTEDEIRRFIIVDNIGYGEHDWDVLANEWDEKELIEWGLDIPNFETGDIIELDKITTTFNLNIKCDTPDELEQLKFKLGITSNSIHSTQLLGLLA